MARQVIIDGLLITAERIDPFEMYWDSNASKRNLTDATYVMRARKMPVEEAETRWPKIKGIMADSTGMEDGQSPHDATNAWRYENDASGSAADEKMYLILQCQWHKDEDIYRVLDPESGQIVNLSKSKFDKAQELLGDNLRFVKTKQRKFYQTWVTGDTVLEEGPCPSEEGFTLKAMCAKRDRNKGGWYGVVRALRDPQKFSNKFFSDIIYILASNRKGGAFIEVDALADPRRAEEDWAKPDALIKLNPGGLAKIQERDPGIFPTGLDRLMQYAINAVPETSGLNPELIGMADRAQPGILEAQRKQAGLTVLAPLFGLLIDMIEELYGERKHAYRDQVMTAALQVGRRYTFDELHGTTVARYAARLFDETRVLHNLGVEYRVLLEVAALLHDIGTIVSLANHHKHSHYLLSFSPVVGLSQAHMAVVANVARYHRKSFPKVEHDHYRVLSSKDRVVVTKHAALLRVADALDNEHAARVSGFSVEFRKPPVVLRLEGEGDLLLERWAVAKGSASEGWVTEPSGPRRPFRLGGSPGGFEVVALDAVDGWVPWMRVGEDERPILRDVIEDENIVPLVAFGPTQRGELDQDEGHPEQAWLLALELRDLVRVRMVHAESDSRREDSNLLLQETDGG